MKRLMLSFLLTVIQFSLANCSKENDKQLSDVADALTGSWELRRTSATMSSTATDYPSGNGNIITFTKGGYMTYANETPVKEGTYTLTYDTTVDASVCLDFPEGQFTTRIVFDSDGDAAKTFIQISGKKLTFISGCYATDGGHSEEYERQ